MTSNNNASRTPADKLALLENALEKNQEVKEKVEDRAVELSIAHETVKKEFASGLTLQQAKKACPQNESVEGKVQECADELREVKNALAEQINDHDKLNHELVETRQKLAAVKNILCSMRNVLTATQEVAEKAKQHTLRDFTTGIPNRELFNDHLEQALGLAKRYNWTLAVMFIDLDRFKLINDTYGHAIGDEVLQAVAKRLEEHARSEDTVCRYGGDEFLYLLVNPGSQNIERIAKSVFDRISQTLRTDDLTLTIEPSIGIAVYPDDASSGSKLIANADAAMYQAKNTKAGYVFFDTIKDCSTRDLP